MSSTVTFVFQVLYMIAFGIALILHTLGIVAIYIYKKKTNQRFILLALSIAEMSLILCSIIQIFTSIDYTTIIVIKKTIILEMIFIMCILTLDRLVCVTNPLKYHIRVTTWKIKFLVCVTWLVSMVMAVLRFMINRTVAKIVLGLNITIGVVLIILIIITYSLVLIKLKHSNEQFQTYRATVEGKVKRQFLVPAIILITFIFLYGIPSLIIHFSESFDQNNDYEKSGDIKILVCLLLQRIGLAADPFVYILFSKHYRGVLVKWFPTSCCFWRRNSNGYSTNGIELQTL